MVDVRFLVGGEIGDLVNICWLVGSVVVVVVVVVEWEMSTKHGDQTTLRKNEFFFFFFTSCWYAHINTEETPWARLPAQKDDPTLKLEVELPWFSLFKVWKAQPAEPMDEGV